MPGIESWVSAPERLRLLDAVGSPAVQVYYDVCNATVQEYDIFKEIRGLGNKRIGEFYLKENWQLLGRGRVDLARVRRVPDEISYSGWLHLEGAVPKNASMLDSLGQNNKTVRALFR